MNKPFMCNPARLFFLIFINVISLVGIAWAEEVPSWLKELENVSNSNEPAKLVPPSPSVPQNKAALKRRLQEFVVQVDANAEALKVLTDKYTVFLRGVAEINASCRLDTALYDERSQKDFGWIYGAALDTCDREVKALKDYARQLALRLNEAEALQSEFSQHAIAATEQLDRMALIEFNRKNREQVDAANRLLDDTIGKIESLK